MFVDECHLLWGDVTGIVWAAAFGGKLPPETCLGKSSQRIEVPVVNERQRQTYFGALNCCTKEFVVKAYTQGNSQSTVEFLQYLQQQYPHQRLALFWDSASIHRSLEIKTYLQAVNQNLTADMWAITCTRFAPHAPEQKESRSGKFARPGFPAQNFSRQMFGYRQNDLFVPVPIFANPLVL